MVVGLFKIVRCGQHAEGLLDGVLHCNMLGYFRREVDKFEGSAFLHPTTMQLRDGIDSTTLTEGDFAGPVTLTPHWVDDLNVFCMFSWRMPKVGDGKVEIDLEPQLGSIRDCVGGFGEHVVVVTDTAEFLRRVERAAHREGFLDFWRGAVEYVDPNTFRTNPTEPWKFPRYKDQQFAHEKEFRFVFRTGRKPAGLLKLCIGSIRNIAFRMKTADVYDSVEVWDRIAGRRIDERNGRDG